MCISFPPCSPSCLLDSLLWVTRKKQGGGALKSYKRLIVKTFKSQVVWYLLNAATVTALCSSVGSQRKHVRSLIHNLCVCKGDLTRFKQYEKCSCGIPWRRAAMILWVQFLEDWRNWLMILAGLMVWSQWAKYSARVTSSPSMLEDLNRDTIFEVTSSIRRLSVDSDTNRLFKKLTGFLKFIAPRKHESFISPSCFGSFVFRWRSCDDN